MVCSFFASEQKQAVLTTSQLEKYQFSSTLECNINTDKFNSQFDVTLRMRTRSQGHQKLPTYPEMLHHLQYIVVHGFCSGLSPLDQLTHLGVEYLHYQLQYFKIQILSCSVRHLLLPRPGRWSITYNCDRERVDQTYCAMKNLNYSYRGTS